MEKHDFDVIIIGGGPGGYVAAIRAAQLGARVCLVEKQSLGGTCLNWGCIPTKALYRSAEVCQLVKNSAEFGIVSSGAEINWEQVQGRKHKVVDQLVGGIAQLMKANGITVVKGEAAFTGANELSVKNAEGETTGISAGHIIIATGSKPAVLPIEGADLPGVLDSTGLLAIDHIPSRLAIIGGGVIGMEFATIFNAFGSQVTVIEFLPSILAQLDGDISKRMAPMMKKKGIELLTGSRVMKIEGQEELKLLVSTKKGDLEITADKVLMAAGRLPVVDGLLPENAGVAYDRKGIGTNGYGQTNVPHIYAIGDVTGGIMLAHTASHQGIAAAEHIMGLKPHQNGNVVPSCVFTFPEIAAAGMTEEEAAAKGIAFKTGKFMFGANGKALTLGEGEGLLKVISDENDIIIGVHIMGPHASDLIHEGVLAIGMRISAEDIIGTIHAHPTLGEVFSEAVMGLKGIALHAAPARKSQVI
ncbi:MAG TPA: dihydrolipoyl dehydrogenase [Clostridia bacterium]|nr:dihydrolipoyl dehydrogenase [Clostridia bacterium]